jgi:hypothetical protein
MSQTLMSAIPSLLLIGTAALAVVLLTLRSMGRTAKATVRAQRNNSTSPLERR